MTNLGEFSEVGDIVREFASDSATVVVGTVIDPEMTEELEVTVVATGLGGEREKPTKVVDNTRTLDGNRLQPAGRPAVLRRRAVTQGNVAGPEQRKRRVTISIFPHSSPAD